MKAVYAFIKSQKGIICGLCAFLMFLSFKPSEPYLSQYLVCNKDTQQDYCSGFSNSTDCSENPPCTWMVSVDSIDYCSATTCFNVPHNDCGNSDYSYCKKDGQSCKDAKCYKSFSEDQVNDEIYPWSTYAYLPFLLLLGPAAELCSYRVAILIGISGRLVTRFLLLYGESILDMQLMQVSYAFGTAAEDVLSAYVYYTLSPAYYQLGTSYIKATSLATNVVAGIVGDLLVVEGNVSLRTLMWISAVSVCLGYLVGVVVLRRPPNIHAHPLLYERAHGDEEEEDEGRGSDEEGAAGALSHAREPLLLSCPPLEKASDAVSSGGFNGGGGVHARVADCQRSSCHENKNNNNSSVNSHIRSSSSGDPNVAATDARSHTMQEKLRQFREQLFFLAVAFRSRTLTALIGFWVVGNAVFSTLYDYEVAVYAELNGGSNAWNGSVLAAMLLAGTVGALLPTWLKHDVYDVDKGSSNSKSDRDTQNSSSSPTAAAEKESAPGNTASTRGNEQTSPEDKEYEGEEGKSQQQEAAFSSSSDFVVGMRVTVAGILSCVNLLLFVISWQVIASVSFLALFFATWQYINVVCFARLALALKVAQLEHGGAHQNNSSSSSTAESTDTKVRQSSSEFTAKTIVPMERAVSQDQHHRRSEEDGRNPLAFPLQSPLHPQDIAQTSASTTAQESSPPPPLQQQQQQDLRPPSNSISNNGAKRSLDDIPEPPYSVALVSVIALNVVVQIVLQAVTFSGLALPLRASCWIFVLTFCVATGVYVLCLLCWFGQEKMRSGLQHVFSSISSNHASSKPLCHSAEGLDFQRCGIHICHVGRIATLDFRGLSYIGFEFRQVYRREGACLRPEMTLRRTRTFAGRKNFVEDHVVVSIASGSSVDYPPYQDQNEHTPPPAPSTIATTCEDFFLSHVHTCTGCRGACRPCCAQQSTITFH